MAGKGHSEQLILRVLQEVEGGRDRGRGMSQALNQPAELLPLEEEVCRPRPERPARVAVAWGREQ